MKKSKKSRVSWASDSMLCQVKTFLTEDCPAKVASRNPSNLQPGFEPTEYAARRFISGIPRIQWKRPPKFILNDALRVGSGGESTETHSENLRIAKVLEAFYPHRSVIPARPWVSLAVLEEHFDDANTPNIRLTPIEDDPDLVAGVSGLAPDLSLAASAALSALMKTKNQGSLVDPDLLVKLLSDPKIVKNLLSDMTGKALEVTANNTHITKPQLVTDRNPPPNPGIGVPHNVPVSVRAPPLLNPTQLNLQSPASVFHTYPLPRVEDSYTAAPLKPTSPVDDLVVSEQKTQQSPGISTWNLDINRDDQVPVKNVDYYKNLIREHGGVNPATNETNKYKGRVDDDMKLVRVKIQKPCMFFGRAKGCRLGERCLYLHDRPKRSWTDVASHFPRAKRLKFGT